MNFSMDNGQRPGQSSLKGAQRRPRSANNFPVRSMVNLLIWFLGFFPAALFLFTSSSAEWSSTTTTLNTLGRITGVAGLSFMLVAAMLSCRVPGFDKFLGGLDKLWVTHHRLAATSFLLLLTHPLLLAFSGFTVSLNAGTSILFPGPDAVPIILGWLALIVTMVFLAPSFAFFGDPDYQRWKFVHKLAGVALVLALVHGFTLARHVNYLWEYIIWSLYAGLAVFAMLYRWGFSRQLWFRRHGRLRYKVVTIARPLTSVVELELEPQDGRLTYEPGQFIYLTPYDKRLQSGYGQEHPYTLSSAPDELNLRLAVKDLGDASHALQSIEPGSPVRVEGPYGAFLSSSDPEEGELWIAGGIGITPFLSQARYFARNAIKVDVHCILCVQDESRALYRNELETIAADVPGFAFTMHYFYREGPLAEKFVRTHCPDFKTRHCYICGPRAMILIVEKLLRSSGIHKNRIHTEEFNLL